MKPVQEAIPPASKMRRPTGQRHSNRSSLRTPETNRNTCRLASRIHHKVEDLQLLILLLRGWPDMVPAHIRRPSLVRLETTRVQQSPGRCLTRDPWVSDTSPRCRWRQDNKAILVSVRPRFTTTHSTTPLVTRRSGVLLRRGGHQSGVGPTTHLIQPSPVFNRFQKLR